MPKWPILIFALGLVFAAAGVFAVRFLLEPDGEAWFWAYAGWLGMAGFAIASVTAGVRAARRARISAKQLIETASDEGFHAVRAACLARTTGPSDQRRVESYFAALARLRARRRESGGLEADDYETAADGLDINAGTVQQIRKGQYQPLERRVRAAIANLPDETWNSRGIPRQGRPGS